MLTAVVGGPLLLLGALLPLPAAAASAASFASVTYPITFTHAPTVICSAVNRSSTRSTLTRAWTAEGEDGAAAPDAEADVDAVEG